MRVRLLSWLSVGLLIAGAPFIASRQAAAQAGEPYKLGTFSIDGRQTVGVVPVIRSSSISPPPTASTKRRTRRPPRCSPLAT